MIRHTLTPLPNGNFLLKMTQDGRCLQTTDVTREDIDNMLEVLRQRSGIGSAGPPCAESPGKRDCISNVPDVVRVHRAEF